MPDLVVVIVQYGLDTLQSLGVLLHLGWRLSQKVRLTNHMTQRTVMFFSIITHL
jgi:hypothetical protein